MIVDPNESPDGEDPRRKMILLIVLAVHILFTGLDACVFHGTFANWLIDATGPGKLMIENLEYRIKPRQNEIVMSWTETVMRGARQGKEETFTRSIPLEPLPPEFARCYVEVTVNPYASPAGTTYYINTNTMPEFGENNVIRTEPEHLTEEDRGEDYLPPDMVFHLAVRPEDLHILSHEFIVTAKIDGYKISRVLFPLSGRRNDSRREMLLSTTELSPYYDELKEKIEANRYKRPSIGGMLLRIVLMPIVAIPDYVMLIVHIIVYIFFISWWAGTF